MTFDDEGEGERASSGERVAVGSHAQMCFAHLGLFICCIADQGVVPIERARGPQGAVENKHHSSSS